MSKSINAFISAQDEESESAQGTRLIFLDFNAPKNGPYPAPGPGCRERFLKKKNTSVPHDRVTTVVREVKYLRDGYTKEEGELKPRKIVLESHGTEIVEEVLVPRDQVSKFGPPAIRGSVIRDLRRKELSQDGN
jgi:hypothetical protein